MTFISIIIPVKPGLEPRALQRIISLAWPPSRFELLIAEGTNPGRQRNQAAQQAHGEIIYFLDDDSLVVTDALQRLERHFDDPQVLVVGGPSLTPASDTFLQRAIGAVLSSLLGAGGVRNRYRAAGAVRETTERELILCNLAIRRDLFLAAGGLDERLYPNEENELLDRLRKGGGKLLHDPAFSVERSQRSSLAAFIKQMFRYGRGRAEQTRIAGITGLMPFVPMFFVLYLLTLPFTATPLCLLPLLMYAFACCVCGLHAAFIKKNQLYLLLTPFLFPLLHISNGLGILAGFLFHRNRHSCYNQQLVTVRCLQPEPDPTNPGAIRWT